MNGNARRELMRRGFLADTRGAAAVEFVLWVTFLAVPILSAFDIGAYVFQQMQTQIAGQAAVQYVWHTCDYTLNGVPAFSSVKCPKLSLANITTAAQSTTLGSNVSVSSVQEGYYCPTTGGALTAVGTASSTIGTAPTGPADCSGVIAGSKMIPGDYVVATVSYTYSPIFSGLSIGSILTSPITQTAYMRLD